MPGGDAGGGQEICVFYYNKVEVQAASTLLAYGSRPFALVAKDMMIIRGTVDVSSRLVRTPADRRRGAGGGTPASPGLCSFTSEPQSAGGGGAGGAGGTLATQGGAGGVGNTDGNGGGMADRAGGTPGQQLLTLAQLRGGCDGQNGAPGVGNTGATGGMGGGAVYLSAASLQILGNILAGGSGGAGAPENDDGGSGGGSGGVIVLESPSLTISGQLLATGGGGGRGSNTGVPAAPGSDATTTTPAPGGSNSTPGGQGGAGATNVNGAPGMENDGGGGGGGGGTGFIQLRGKTPNTGGAMIMPPAGFISPLPI